MVCGGKHWKMQSVQCNNESNNFYGAQRDLGIFINRIEGQFENKKKIRTIAMADGCTQ